jgi:drug/metabolite transporter superfamily protein YnfA
MPVARSLALFIAAAVLEIGGAWLAVTGPTSSARRSAWPVWL